LTLRLNLLIEHWKKSSIFAKEMEQEEGQVEAILAKKNVQRRPVTPAKAKRANARTPLSKKLAL